MELKDLRALEVVLNTLEPLSDEDRVRVLRWTIEKLGINDLTVSRTIMGAKSAPIDAAFDKHPHGFETIGDFVAAANPKSDADRVLCASVFLQDFADEPSPEQTLTGKQINDVLKNLGHGVKNITDSINTLKARKPQHMIQTKKSGKAKQAWKEYRVTRAGIDHVYRLIAEGSNETNT